MIQSLFFVYDVHTVRYNSNKKIPNEKQNHIGEVEIERKENYYNEIQSKPIKVKRKILGAPRAYTHTHTIQLLFEQRFIFNVNGGRIKQDNVKWRMWIVFTMLTFVYACVFA